MAIPGIAIAAVTALGAGLVYYLATSSKSSGAGSTAAASALGQKDGCAAGTSDAKSGVAEALNPSDGADPKAIAASGNPDAYKASYDSGFSSCYAKASTPAAPPPTSGGGGKTVKPPPGVKPGVTLSRSTLEAAYSSGCIDGARAGYMQGFNGSSRNPSPNSSLAAASGNIAAYGAAYSSAYSSAYSKGSSDAAAGKAAPGTPDPSGMATDSLDERVLGINLGCSAGFTAWLELYIGSTGAKVAGFSPSGGSAIVGMARALGIVAGRRPPVFYGDRHRAIYGSSSWPAPPDGARVKTFSSYPAP